MSTSQLHLFHHLGRTSPSTQGIISLIMVGNQDLQPLLLPMEPTMAQCQAISRHLLKVCREPHLPQGYLQPLQHRSLMVRLHKANLGYCPLGRAMAVS